MTPASSLSGVNRVGCVLYAFPHFLSHQDCDVLLELAQRQRGTTALMCGVMCTDGGLDSRERDALSRPINHSFLLFFVVTTIMRCRHFPFHRFDKRLEEITGAQWQGSKAQATCATTTPWTCDCIGLQFKLTEAPPSSKLSEQVSSDDNGESSSEEDHPPQIDKSPGLWNGLHVDTHNGQDRRFASVILYLNDLPPGCVLLGSMPSDSSAILRYRWGDCVPKFAE